MISNWSNLVARRDLIRELVLSDLKTTAAETKLGWLWWLLDPLIMMAIYWVFIVIIFGRDKYAPYPIFIGCALLPWKHFSSCTSRAVKVLRSQASLIKSAPFPTMALPLSLVFSQFTYFLFGLIALLITAILFGVPVTAKLIQIPLLMILQLALVAGTAMAVSCVGVLMRDLETFLAHALRVGWYLSPGIYGIDLVEKKFGPSAGAAHGDLWVGLYMLNPFAILFSGYRAALHDPQWLELHHWGILGLEAAVVLAAGYFVYQHYDRRVIKFI